MQAKLADLIRQPTAAERKAFQAIASEQITVTRSELALIQAALYAYEVDMHRASEDATGRAKLYLADNFCRRAIEAGTLSRKLSEASR